MTSSWLQLFCHPIFRKAWEDHVAGRPWTEEQADNVVYIFGRHMAAESGLPLPRYANHLTDEMVAAIKKCVMFERQMIVTQWLRAHGDPSLMDQELGIKQGDEA